MLCRKRTVQADLEQADLLALGNQVVDHFFESLTGGAHGDDDAFGIGCTNVIEGLVIAAGQSRNLVHVLFDDGRDSIIFIISSLTTLEVDIRVLGGAATSGCSGFMERARNSATLSMFSSGFMSA